MIQSPEQIEWITDSTRWLVLWPELCLVLLALAVLVMDLTLPASRKHWITGIAMAVQAALLALLFLPGFGVSEPHAYFGGMIEISPQGQIFRGFFLLCGLLTAYLADRYTRSRGLPRVEFLHLLLLATVGLMLLSQSSHFVMLFVALELVTVTFYVLIGYHRRSSASLEAGLKYLVLGGLSSALLLFGIVLLYGAAGLPGLFASTGDPLQFTDLSLFIRAHPDHPLVVAGALLVLSGVAFKIGAFPFQIWIPDVYQGAPIPTTAFLAVASKAGGIIVLLILVQTPFAGLEAWLRPLLMTVAALTILFGNITALVQRNVKRIMGLSGISHAGFLLMGVCASFGPGSVSWAANAVLFYLLVYLLASYALFLVMNILAPAEDSLQTLDDYANLGRERPFLGAALAVALGSLAGIPPLAGFIGKLLIFIAAYQAGMFALLTVAIIGVVVSIFYYFGWILAAFVRRTPLTLDGESSPVPGWPRETGAERTGLGILTALTIILGFYQGFLWFLL